VIASPKLDECFLNDVFRVSARPHPLPGEKQQAGCEFRKTTPPIFVSGDILHDLSRSFIFKTPPNADFV